MSESFTIDPDAVYNDATLVIGLGITLTTLRQARRSGTLRATRKGRRVLYRGQWVIDRLERDVPAMKKGVGDAS